MTKVGGFSWGVDFPVGWTFIGGGFSWGVVFMCYCTKIKRTHYKKNCCQVQIQQAQSWKNVCVCSLIPRPPPMYMTCYESMTLCHTQYLLFVHYVCRKWEVLLHGNLSHISNILKCVTFSKSVDFMRILYKWNRHATKLLLKSAQPAYESNIDHIGSVFMCIYVVSLPGLLLLITSIIPAGSLVIPKWLLHIFSRFSFNWILSWNSK